MDVVSVDNTPRNAVVLPIFPLSGFCLNPQENRYPIQGSELQDGISSQPYGNAMDEVSAASKNALYSKHLYPSTGNLLGWWPAILPDSFLMQQYQLTPFEGQFQFYHLGTGYNYPLNNMPAQGYSPEHQSQDFQHFVVVDFEATCDKERNPHPQEIIEFPSLIVCSKTGQIKDRFHKYVRPTYNQLLSDFCKDLTGIQQTQVDEGISLSEALLKHDEWLGKCGIKHTNFAVVTWSNWDCRVMLESECRYKKIRKPHYFNRWINLKVPFQEVFGTRRCNLKEAVEMAGLTWQGRAHCGLDDAKNTARLLSLLLHRGIRFSITSKLTLYDNDDQTLMPTQQHFIPPYQPYQNKDIHKSISTYYPYCFCGVKSKKSCFLEPGWKQGNFFFGCGSWPSKGYACSFFEWASS